MLKTKLTFVVVGMCVCMCVYANFGDGIHRANCMMSAAHISKNSIV